ncbi:hypothetical protein D6C95_01123 [Aureobasidium pullulans]|nr:hypothetical protein D6C95_01123 [Aureobasidium pullulans]
MGRISEESASARSSFDAEGGEGLPLYSDISVAQAGELTAPPEKATADEVREFLMQLLIKNRGLHQDHARRVASKWTLGTGRELISYPPSLYAEIFGLEDAWMVYKEAKVFIGTEKNKKKRVNVKYLALFILSALWGSALTVAIVADFETHGTVKATSILASFLLGMIWLIFVLVNFLEQTTLEGKIERQLINGLGVRSKD